MSSLPFGTDTPASHANGSAASHRAIDRTVERAERAAGWLRDGGDRVRHQLSEASDRTVDYVRHRPVRSVLMVASAALLLLAAVQLLSAHDDR